jgi:Fe2+ transport system protein FeoA
MHDVIPLAQLPTGRIASVSTVLGPPEVVHRLDELGLRQGTVVEMVQAGTPCIIRFAGQKVCFRTDELLTVLVAWESPS